MSKKPIDKPKNVTLEEVESAIEHTKLCLDDMEEHFEKHGKFEVDDVLEKWIYDCIRVGRNKFKVGDEVVFKEWDDNPCNNGLPLLLDVQFFINSITHKKDKSKETTVDLVFSECKAHYYKIKNQECKLIDEGSYKIANVPISAITKEV